MPRVAQGESLRDLIGKARACRVCAPSLSHEPNPVFRVDSAARIVIIGQAPGSKVHASGVAWDDDSGDRLREWLGVNPGEFDDPTLFAILPMGFCYPGKGKSGDLPPRPECAPLWHPPILEKLTSVRLTLLVGQYAQIAYLGRDRKKTLTENVRCFLDSPNDLFPLPHPAWRSRIWMTRNPWFETEVLPELRRRVQEGLKGGS